MTSILALSLPPEQILLLGAAVLLAVALALRLMRGRDAHSGIRNEQLPMAPDLRWWRNSQA